MLPLFFHSCLYKFPKILDRALKIQPASSNSDCKVAIGASTHQKQFFAFPEEHFFVNYDIFKAKVRYNDASKLNFCICNHIRVKELLFIIHFQNWIYISCIELSNKTLFSIATYQTQSQLLRGINLQNDLYLLANKSFYPKCSITQYFFLPTFKVILSPFLT